MCEGRATSLQNLTPIGQRCRLPSAWWMAKRSQNRSTMPYTNLWRQSSTRYLMDLVGPDSCLAMHNDDPKLPTRTLFKSLFPAEFTQAILHVKVQHTVLHLCLAHWKAETVINQIFL